MTKHDDWIAARGWTSIAEQVRFSANGQYAAYPVSSKYSVTRLKAYDSTHAPKYLWEPKDAERPTYYALAGFTEAVKTSQGQITGAAGEPDVWTFNAAGMANALCWFGEGAIPDSLIDDLTGMGCTEFVYYPDHDLAGLQAAQKLVDLWKLHTPAFPLVLRWRSATWLHTGFDINRLWIECQFDPEAFQVALDQYTALTPETLEAILKPHAAPLPHKQNELVEVEKRARTLITQALVKRGKKDGVYECPMAHGVDGKDFLYSETKIGGCQGKHAGMLTRWVDLANYLEIDLTAIARDVAQESRQTKTDQNSDRPLSLLDASQPPKFKVVPSDVMYGDLLDYHSGDKITDNEIFLNPYKPLQKFKGTRLCVGRKSSLVIGIEGGGKTSFLARWLLNLRAGGYDAFLWSAEWSPMDWGMFDVERFGGPDYERQMEAHMYHLEERRGVRDKIVGKRFSDAEEKQAMDCTARLMALPGHIHFLDEPGASVEDICEIIRSQTPELRAKRRRPMAAVIDYGQLLKRRGGGWDEIEHVAGSLNSVCHEMNLHLMLAAQARTELADRVRKGDFIMGQNSAQGLSSQRFQAVYTLNPQYHITGVRHEQMKINIAKANFGPAPIVFEVETALYRHDFTDKVIDSSAATQQLEEALGYGY